MPLNPETLKAVKEQAAAEVYEQFCGILNECQVPVIVDIVATRFITEVERQAGEIAELRRHVADLNHDLEATIKHCNDYDER